MIKPIPQALENHKNLELLAFLEPLSCHGDIVEPLDKVLSEFPEWKSYCPNGRDFLYNIWYLNGVIFAFAVGMHSVWFRISENEIETASMMGEREYVFDGDTWFACQYNHESLKDMATLAYEYAKIG